MSIVITDPINYTHIANSIRNKNGLSTVYKPSEMSLAIDALNVGGVISLQDKSVTPTTSTQLISKDNGYDGLGIVTVNAIPSAYIIPSGTFNITANNTYDITSYASVFVNVSGGGGSPTISSLSVTPTESAQTFNASGVDGYKPVTVAGISSTYVGTGIPRKSSADLTASGSTITVVSGYYSAQATKNVSAGTAGTPTATKGTVSNHSISVTPKVTNTAGYISGGTLTGTAVTVSASELVSGTLSITANGTGINVTNYASVDVAIPGDNPTISSLAITPTESEQTFNSSSVDGYKPVTVSAISSTYVGTGITRRSSSDLTASGATVTVPSGYYSSQATKAVSSGSATAPASISGTSATVSTGTNTLTLTKTVSVTPSVTAGYISSGTAGNASVSLTASVTTQGTRTITPTTTNQTISSGTYITGTQTISGDANLVAGNIKSGTSIFGVTGSYSGLDTSDATAVATDIVSGKTAYVDGRKVEGSLVIQRYYTGSSVPSSSLGTNGDIYFQS